jgi:dTMP kinase
VGRSSFIIGIEGVDAVGKQTQSLLLEQWLGRNGFECAGMAFPDYKTPIGKEIQAFLSAERDFPAEVRHMLFAANRWEKVSVIRRYRDEGKVIIVDRYTESNIVYGSANGLSIEWLAALEEGIPKTDLVLILDAPPKLLDSRRSVKDSYERNQDLQVRTSALYKELAPRFGWSVIDATRSVEEIHDSIVGLVKPRLIKRGKKAR